jgi:glycosyltransferase involved in cell wall biosynthesis
MNILCISPYFVPLADPEAYCGAKVALALQDHAANVTVLSKGLSHPPTGRKVDDSKLWRKAVGMTFEVGAPTTDKNFRSLYLGVKFQTVVYARWVGAVVKLAKELHSNESFDIVYSRSLPMFAHIAGYRVSRALGVPWVANINDPWDFHLFPNRPIPKMSRVEAAFSAHWLKKTLRCANLITYPSSRLRDYVSRLGGEQPRGKIIPHIGYTTIDQKDSGYFNLLHAGMLGSWVGRPPEGLLRGCAGFLKENETARSLMRLTLVGPVDEQTVALVGKLGLNSVVRHLGRVGYEESIRHIRSATFCVLVEADGAEGIYLPSKLADYILAQKPILALSPSVGVLSDMVPHGGIIRVSPNDETSIAETIGKLYKAFLSHSLHEYMPPNQLVRQFEAGPIAEKLLSELSHIIKNKNGIVTS